MFKFKIAKKSNKDSLKAGVIETRHGSFSTPAFIAVGTKGTVKSVTPKELKRLNCQIVLANTYHLYLRPGEKLIKKLGGLHKFMKWPGPILTDSGGFQVYSLNSKMKIRQNGIEFYSHLDGSKHFFTPERVIQIQKDLAADIIMPLDICLPATAPRKEHKKAVDLTIKWAKRSKKELTKTLTPKPYQPILFGIIQGGICSDLRKYCAKKIIKIGFDGYAIGGLAVGESKKDLWQMVKLMDKILPKDKPRYLMGVGEPEDLIKATQLGMDIFDCVLPTRLARHGIAWTTGNCPEGNLLGEKFTKIDFRKSRYKNDPRPIMSGCKCPACKNNFSKAYISHLIREKEILGLRLLTLHNLWLIQTLMGKIRQKT